LKRREIIRLFAATAVGLGASRILPTVPGLASAAARAPESAAPPIAPVLQDSSATEPLLPLFPLRLVLFPESELALHIFEERYKQMIRDCLLHGWEFGIVLMRGDSFETVGCTAGITEILRSYRNGELDILVRGKRRFEISKLNREKPYLRGEAAFFEDDENDPPSEALQQQATEHYTRLVELLRAKDPAIDPPALSLQVGHLSFQIMTAIPADHDSQQHLLALRSEHDRLVQVILHMQQVIDFLENGSGAAAPKGRA
jgi:ATP-dependent Lon protease